jgi:hypothetical protein
MYKLNIMQFRTYIFIFQFRNCTIVLYASTSCDFCNDVFYQKYDPIPECNHIIYINTDPNPILPNQQQLINTTGVMCV